MANGPRVSIAFHGLDLAQAAALLRAIPPTDTPEPTHWLVSKGSQTPPGHTYRELADAHRRGDLRGTRTPQGLRFSQADLANYEATKAQRRRRPARKQPSLEEAFASAGVVFTKDND